MCQLRSQKAKATAQSSQLPLFLTLNYRRFTCQSTKAAQGPQHHRTEEKGEVTYSPNFAQIASDTLRMISEPSKKTESQIFKTVWLGRHVAKRVRNHCIVKTFVSGGSYPPEIKQTLHFFRIDSLQDIKAPSSSLPSPPNYVTFPD